MAAIDFPTSPANDDTYDFGGTTYRYDALNNRWIADAAGGGSIVVQQARPDPATSSAGDLWWYCGADGEDPALFVLVADNSTPPIQHWMDASPGVAFETQGAGGTTVGTAPTSLDAGSLFYRYDETDPDNTATYNRLYIALGDGVYRQIALASTANDLLTNPVGTEPDVTGVVATPTMSFTTGNSTGTVDVSALDDDQWIVIYAVGSGGGGAFSNAGAQGGGGGGGALIAAIPKILAGDTITYSIGTRGSQMSATSGAVGGTGIATVISFSGEQATLSAAGGPGGRSTGGGGGGRGNSLWPETDGIFSTELAVGTMAGIPDITSGLNGGAGGTGTSTGGIHNARPSVFGGAGGSSGGGSSATSTYAGTFGRGGNYNSNNATTGFVRFYFPR